MQNRHAKMMADFPSAFKSRPLFYNSAITQPLVCARIEVEIGSHLTKWFLFNHTTLFSTRGLEKSLCNFTGTIVVQCENPVFGQIRSLYAEDNCFVWDQICEPKRLSRQAQETGNRFGLPSNTQPLFGVDQSPTRVPQDSLLQEWGKWTICTSKLQHRRPGHSADLQSPRRLLHAVRFTVSAHVWVTQPQSCCGQKPHMDWSCDFHLFVEGLYETEGTSCMNIKEQAEK